MTHHLTVELLDALDVIMGKSEVLGESVNGCHQCSRVLGVLQAKGVTKLMGCHQEQTVAWKTRRGGGTGSIVTFTITGTAENVHFGIFVNLCFYFFVAGRINKTTSRSFKVTWTVAKYSVTILVVLTAGHCNGKYPQTRFLYLGRDRSPICGHHRSSWR